MKLYNVQGINIVQTGTTTQAITSLSQGLVDGIITSAPLTFRLMKDGYRELVSPKDFKKAGVEFLIQGLVARKSFAAKNRERRRRHDQSDHGRGQANFRQREASEVGAGQIYPSNRSGYFGSRPTDSRLMFLSKIPR